MFDEDEKTNDVEQNVIEIEEKPKTSEQQVTDLEEDFLHLKRRVIALEEELKIVQDKLRKMSFTPGL